MVLMVPLIYALGQRVLLLSRNTDLLLEALVAILACGAVAVPLNVRWKAKEVTSAMLLCQPTLVLCEPCFLALLPEVGIQQCYLLH